MNELSPEQQEQMIRKTWCQIKQRLIVLECAIFHETFDLRKMWTKNSKEINENIRTSPVQSLITKLKNNSGEEWMIKWVNLEAYPHSMCSEQQQKIAQTKQSIAIDLNIWGANKNNNNITNKRLVSQARKKSERF